MFSIFSDELKLILNDARKEMILLKHSYIGTEHFVLSILKNDCLIKSILNNNNINYDNFKEKVLAFVGEGNSSSSLVVFTPLFKKLIEDSIMVATDLKKNEVDLPLLFSLMLNEGEGVAYRIFCENGIDITELENSIESLDYTKKEKSYALNFGINLNEKAINGELDPVIGRDKEVSRLIEIILRKNKCNPILIGEAGVGKTSIVEEFARRIVNGDVPLKLRNKIIISISMADLVSGTKYRGEFEEKLLKLIKELESNNNIILFIDEIHTLVGAGGADGAIDASNIFKPVLARGNITVIGATTTEEYKKYIEDDKALSRRFQKIIVEEPTKEDLLDILIKVKPYYEKFHNVVFDNNLLRYLIKVSGKYILNRKEPDRSLDILDEVCSYTTSQNNDLEEKNIKLRKKLMEIRTEKNKLLKENLYEEAIDARKQEREVESLLNKNEMEYYEKKEAKIVKKEYIDKVISQKCGIDVNSENVVNNALKKQKTELKKKVLHQDNIIDILLDASLSLFCGDKTIEKPISFVFRGKPGMGKTYLAMEIGRLLFNNHIIKVNLDEFRDEQSISRIVGAPPGYVGYNNKNNVFESLKEYNSSLILLENIEKANPKVKNLINQILDIGYFEDSNGYKIDFKNSLIIITSTEETNSVGFENNMQESPINNKNVLYFNDLNYLDICKIIKTKLNEKKIKYSNSDIKRIANKTNYEYFGAKKVNELVNQYNKYLVN